jgi:FlaA1/EpsC-like NDP-sugar epimerase
LDLLLVAAAMFAASSILYSSDFTPSTAQVLVDRVLVVTAIAAPILFWRRLYAIYPRYMGLYDLVNVTLVAGIMAVVARLNEDRLRDLNITEGWSLPLLFALFICLLLGGWRLIRRIQAMGSIHPVAMRKSRTRKVLIIGATDSGEAVYRELVRDPRHDMAVAGFVDDNAKLHGTTLHGIPVLGSTWDIPKLAQEGEVNEILIALANPSPEEMRRVFDICAETKARIRTLPSIQDYMNPDQNLLPQIRDVDVNDLLRRDMIKADLTASRKYINGERVLITGGGGSIGSELARQVSGLNPSSLVILGKGEGSVFEIEQELKQTKNMRPVPVVCDVRDRRSIDSVFRQQSPSVVFHAAAHKHVPLMEMVPIEAIRNNIFGTLNVAQASMKAGVKKFILVSTDKAVNPGNVMGATKRVAEMIVSSLSHQSDTEFAAVRFGNVLGSRGSLVPLIKKQIRNGGPVTVTHPDMTRYFMTIPEAAELILQAGAMGGSGEIFVLDMGEPVKIVDLVKDIVRMHGLVPGQDIELKYIGIRPGEKMEEELYFSHEDVKTSSHPKIHMGANPQVISWDWMKIQLEHLNDICESGDQDAARVALMELAWAKNLPPVGAAGLK